jgi:hypothetical protein
MDLRSRRRYGPAPNVDGNVSDENNDEEFDDNVALLQRDQAEEIQVTDEGKNKALAPWIALPLRKYSYCGKLAIHASPLKLVEETLETRDAFCGFFTNFYTKNHQLLR